MVKGKGLIARKVMMMYPHLFKKFSFSKDAEGNYMLIILISKDDEEQVEAIKKAINAAYKEGVDNVWNGKEPKSFHNPLKDGDEKDDDTGVFENHYYITLKSKDAPEVVDKDLEPVDAKQVYSGGICNVSMTFLPYVAGGNKGISALLNNVQIIDAGNRINGRKRAADEFAVIKDEDNEEEGCKMPFGVDD